MAAVGRLAGSGLRSLVRFPMSLLGREMSGAAQASMDLEFFHSPSSAVDSQRHDERRDAPQWVFLGCPGVGKGTYASRLAKLLSVPHIAMGDLVRLELKSPSPSSQHLAVAMTKGELLPDEVIFDLLTRRLRAGMSAGERGFILDGFPRTISQAEVLEDVTDIDLVVNLKLREDIIIAKCLGRRTCSTCGGNFNVAEIDVDSADGQPRIHMPPLLPPPDCAHKMVIRSDDTAETVRARLRVYHEESTPVEAYYRNKGKLLDFSVAGGIPETWPNLLAALNLQDMYNRSDSSQTLAA